MGKYLAVITLIIVLGVILIFGRDFFDPSGTRHLEAPEKTLADDNRVAVTHAFKDGIHRYTGTFLLPHSCFQVQQTGYLRDGVMEISFDVVDRLLLEKTCVKITTRYPFTVIVEAPQEAKASFFLNGEEVPSKVREIEWQSASGNFIDTSVTSPTFR